jgi:hypothetical protein
VSGKQHFAFKLCTLDIDGAARLLLRHFSNGTIDADAGQIRDIVDCVGSLPLAVARIATCLKQAKITLAELLAVFKRNQARINVCLLHDHILLYTRISLVSQMINWESFPSIYEGAAIEGPFISRLEHFLRQDAISCIDMLVNVKPSFSPWKFPHEWLKTEADDIRLVVQAISSRHRNARFVEKTLQGLKIYEACRAQLHPHHLFFTSACSV